MHGLLRAGEIGMNLDPGDVGHDEQRRIVQRFAVHAELAVGVGKVAVFAAALVFPSELATPPDVGESALALGAGGRRAAGALPGGIGLPPQQANGPPPF